MVEDGDGKHAAQLGKAIVAVFFVGVYDALGIGVRVELMAALFEIVAQLFEVINLAVKDNPD